MLQVSVKSCRNRRPCQANSQTYSCCKRCSTGSEQLVDIVVKVRVEHVFTEDPVGKECDDGGVYQHQNLDRARSDWLYWTPRRTQSAIGLYAHDDESRLSQRIGEDCTIAKDAQRTKRPTINYEHRGESHCTANVSLTYSDRMH